MFAMPSKGPLIDSGCVCFWERALKGKSELQFRSWISSLVGEIIYYAMFHCLTFLMGERGEEKKA